MKTNKFTLRRSCDVWVKLQAHAPFFSFAVAEI